MMKIKAAILWAQGAPLSVEEAELEAPHAGEVLVEVKAAGVCHSDLHPARGDWPMRTPLALGHEGAGVVREVGADVTRVRVGDHVVFCWAPPCGACVAVIGAGGVGLNVVQGAVLAGCERIIAVDLQPAPLQLAREFGATHTIAASETDAVAIIRELTDGRGADYIFDTVGTDATVVQALESACKGGAVVLTGLARTDAQAPLKLFPLAMQEKRLIGSVYGSGRPLADIPRLITRYQ